MTDDFGPNHAWHLLPSEAWAAAPADAPFAAASLADEGFVHLTHLGSDLVDVGNAFYRDDPRPYLVLSVDLDRLTVPWRYDGDARFPHVYGPLDRAAILAVHAYDRAPDGSFVGIGPPLA